jgi:hypothetical protein
MESRSKNFILHTIVGKYWFKGKGILVPVLFILSVIIVGGAGALIENYFGVSTKGPVAIASMGLILLVCGIFTWFVGRDFIKKDGERIEIDLDNRFLFLKMKHIGLAFILIGLVIIIYGVYKAVIPIFFE